MSAATLVIETSTPQASLALVLPDGRVEERVFQSDRNHNATLFAPLRELLGVGLAPAKACGSHPPRLASVIVGSGPGSYSGTRVGIAAAQGVAIAMGCPAIAVPSLLATAVAAGGDSCLAVGDARRGSFWTARIRYRQLIQEPVLGDAEALLAAVTDALDSGQPVFSFEDPSGLPLPDSHLDAIRLQFPTAGNLWQAWLCADESCRTRWSAVPPQPIYLKPPHITAPKRLRFVKG